MAAAEHAYKAGSLPRNALAYARLGYDADAVPALDGLMTGHSLAKLRSWMAMVKKEVDGPISNASKARRRNNDESMDKWMQHHLDMATAARYEGATLITTALGGRLRKIGDVRKWRDGGGMRAVVDAL
eukprot:303921-Amphidinium_carterae.1